MAITALSKITPEWYAPESEYDTNEETKVRSLKAGATRFRIRPITPPEKEAVSEFTPDGRMIIPPKNYGQVLRFGLLDWDNFSDDNGKPVKFSVTNFDRIPSGVRLDLANEIILRSIITPDEEKN